VSLVVLDTDVASVSLRDRLPDWLRAALAGHTMCITFVTVGELMKRRVLRSWGPNRTADLARWRQRVGVLRRCAAPGRTLTGRCAHGARQARLHRPSRSCRALRYRPRERSQTCAGASIPHGQRTGRRAAVDGAADTGSTCPVQRLLQAYGGCSLMIT
jgi:hypothetical protein